VDKHIDEETKILKHLNEEERGKYFSEPKIHGAIVGEVDITGCVTQSNSPWFLGKFGFHLANAKAYDKPITCKGSLGFFNPKL
jgi:hypothetical protein